MLVGVAGIAGSAVAAAATPLVIAFLAGAIGRSKPQAISATSGAIAPEPVSALLTVAFGQFFSLMGLWAILSGDISLRLVGACGLALGVPIALFMSPSLTRLHVLRWSAAGVDGPSSTFGPTLGLRRAVLPWSEISRAGQTSTGYWFLETQAGERVYWSYLYKGHHAFTQAIGAHCPDLVT